MSEESAPAAPSPKNAGENYWSFTIKVAIVAAVVGLGVVLVAESMVDALVPIKNKLKDQKTKLRVKGLFLTNPAVSYRISFIQEHEGNLDAAVLEMELAMGLLELHSSDRAAKERYAARLQELKNKLAAVTKEKAAR